MRLLRFGFPALLLATVAVFLVERAKDPERRTLGAAITTSFAARYPDRVRSLIYLDPVFNTGRPLPPEERSPLAWTLHMVFRGGTEEMATGQLGDFLHPERHPDWVRRYRVQQQFKGTREALRRTRAAIAMARPSELEAQIGAVVRAR